MRYDINDIFLLEMQVLNNPNLTTMELVKVVDIDSVKGAYTLQNIKGDEFVIIESVCQSQIYDINITANLLSRLGFREDNSSQLLSCYDKCYKKSIFCQSDAYELVVVKDNNGYYLVYGKDGITKFQPITAYCDLQKQVRNHMHIELPFVLSWVAYAYGKIEADTQLSLYNNLFDLTVELGHKEIDLRYKTMEENTVVEEMGNLKTKLLAVCKEINEIYQITTNKSDLLESLYQTSIQVQQRYLGIN